MVLAVRCTGIDRQPALGAVAGDRIPAALGDLYAAGWGLQERRRRRMLHLALGVQENKLLQSAQVIKSFRISMLPSRKQ